MIEKIFKRPKKPEFKRLAASLRTASLFYVRIFYLSVDKGNHLIRADFFMRRGQPLLFAVDNERNRIG